jgi:hypothetical protein
MEPVVVQAVVELLEHQLELTQGKELAEQQSLAYELRA